MKRRDFFTTAAKAIGLAAVIPFLTQNSQAEQRRGARGAAAPAAGGALPLMSVTDPVAKAVKYVEDAKQAPDAKGNNCANCGFYKKVEVRGGKEVGTCTIFPGKVVYAEAYCGSWAKKA